MLEIETCYSNLYKRTSVKTEEECLQYLSKLSTIKLSEDEKSLCEGKLTLNGCWNALSSMKNGKSPGNDGFTKEFYVAFFGELGQLLLKTFNNSFVKGELSASQKQAVITLIQKKDRDVTLIKKWRPISLINVDIKIASKALVARMKTVIHSLISYDQTAYVKGRYIGQIRLIDDLLKYPEDENIDGILFAADIEKAFDSVDHNSMFAALKRFGFGNDFVRWIKTIFKKSQSCVMNNGTSTEYFNLERGARQGYPLSPYLFILAVETLFIQIRSDSSIKGFRIKRIEIKLSAYADDTTFFVKDSQSLQRILKLMKEFQVFSSLTTNVEKCEASWIEPITKLQIRSSVSGAPLQRAALII